MALPSVSSENLSSAVSDASPITMRWERGPVSGVSPAAPGSRDHPLRDPPALTLGTGTASWPDLKAARLHRVSTRHNALHVSEDWSNVCPGGQASGLGPRGDSAQAPDPERRLSQTETKPLP